MSISRNLLLSAAIALGFIAPASAQQKAEFKVGITDYVGYAPLYAADKMGIVKKWADQNGVAVTIVQSKDYSDSLNAFTTGELDACMMTTMDALTAPAAAGTDTTALVLIDFSSGADGLFLKKGLSLKDLKGKSVSLVQYSVSQYLLNRALESVGLSERDVKIVDTSENDLVEKFKSDKSVDAVATWNPHLDDLQHLGTGTMVFTSAKIPGEIIDVIAVQSKVLKDNPKFGKALTGAWFEVMGIIKGGGDKAKEAYKYMAEYTKSSPADVAAALSKTITMFYTPKEAIDFFTSPQMVDTMDRTRKFSVEHKLFGEGVADVNAIGMTFPKGNLGDQGKVLLRFNESYMASSGS